MNFLQGYSCMYVLCEPNKIKVVELLTETSTKLNRFMKSKLRKEFVGKIIPSRFRKIAELPYFRLFSWQTSTHVHISK